MKSAAIRGLVLLAAVTVLSAGTVHGQDSTRAPQRSRQTADSTGAMMDAMMPMWGKMMTAMMRSTLEILTQPETARQMATFTKNYFDALVAKGFTREESLRIVMAVGVPMGPGQR